MIPLVRRKKGPFGVIDGLHGLQSRLAKTIGRPSRGMCTDVEMLGRQVIFIHNPKTGGKSLRSVLGVRTLSHAFPSDRLSERTWRNTYSIVAVRDPFERFLSGYFDHVLKPNENALVRRYGPEFKSICPFQYLDVLAENPKFGGPQILWTNFPSLHKPQADLILRFETIDLWTSQLHDAGVNIGERQLPHSNASSRRGTDLLTRLKLTDTKFDALKQCVKAAYAADYKTFGYS